MDCSRRETYRNRKLYLCRDLSILLTSPPSHHYPSVCLCRRSPKGLRGRGAGQGEKIHMTWARKEPGEFEEDRARAPVKMLAMPPPTVRERVIVARRSRNGNMYDNPFHAGSANKLERRAIRAAAQCLQYQRETDALNQMLKDLAALSSTRTSSSKITETLPTDSSSSDESDDADDCGWAANELM